MRPRWQPLMILCLVAAGCTTDSAPPPAETLQGTEAKRIILAYVQKAKRAPATAANDLSVLRESLDAYAANASGASAETYVKIRDTAQELQDLYAKKAPPAEITAKLDQLAQLAESLPGDAPPAAKT